MSSLIVLLFLNFIVLACVYLYLMKVRKLIGFQLGMNISIMTGGFFSIITGVLLIYQYPLKFVMVTIVTTIAGMLVGAAFGALFDYQTILTGYINGLMIGIMSPMVGAAAQNSYLFLSVIELAFIVSIIFLSFSAKQT
ncbi:hypothetical protein FZW96_15125 [Bacillus sp. BGMRC 2118]|nr:hypothetical protein FZW96_15125 [Bacillus sp. BGMRC 2118]